MKILSKEEAINFIDTYPEYNMYVKVDTKTGELEFVADLEIREICEETPEGYAINDYNWWVELKQLLNNKNISLMDKLSEERGKRCGGIFITDHNGVMKNYQTDIVKGNAVAVLGTDYELQTLLPYLKDGYYLFCFN